MNQARLALALIALAAVAPLHAQTASPEFASTVANTTAEMDEVIVSGKLDSLSQLRKALNRAEDRVYERYNAVNRGTEYDIECTYEAPLGSRQKVRKCQPRYVSDAMHEDAVDVLFRNQNSANRLRSVSALASGRQSFLRQAMLEAAQKDPQMQRAMVEHSLLRERYEKVLKEKLSQHRAVWD